MSGKKAIISVKAGQRINGFEVTETPAATTPATPEAVKAAKGGVTTTVRQAGAKAAPDTKEQA